MNEERNLGVTEARFALTILTCLLVAIGYIALLKLGGSKDPSPDLTADDATLPSIAGPSTIKPPEPPARVLTQEKPDDARKEPPSLAERPPSGQKLPEPKLR